MAGIGSVTVEVRIGPIFETAVDLLELARELYDDAVPEWYPEREALNEKIDALAAALERHMEVG